MITYRRAQPEDMALVLSSWTDSYRTAHAAGMIPMPYYDRVYRDAVEWVLKRPGVEVWVAAMAGETDHAVDLKGWIAVEREFLVPVRTRERVEGKVQWVERLEPETCPLVHFVYVKQPYRRLGCARGLFKAAGVDLGGRFLFTCKTATASKIAERVAPRAEWAPLIARHAKQ